MLTIRYMNGHDVESPQGPQILRKYLPYVRTIEALEQTYTGGGSVVDGFNGLGKAWFLFNTGFFEAVDTMPLGATYASVVFRCHFRRSGTWSNNVAGGIVFLRFENGGPTGTLIQLRTRTDEGADIVLGGDGMNPFSGADPGITVASIPAFPETFIHLEMRVDFGSGRIRIWQNQTKVYDQSGLPIGGGCDRVSFRWEQLGTPGYSRDNIVLATDSLESDEVIGRCRIESVPLIADYLVSGGWTPNSGTSHFALLDEAATKVLDTFSPDDDITHIAGTSASTDELFGVGETSCSGLILAVALNVCSKATAGNPFLSFRHQNDRGVRTTLGTRELESTRYAVQQVIAENTPDGEVWTDQIIQSSAWGFRGTGSGQMRVTTAYVEKLIDLTGLPYDCGGGSYIL